MSTLDEKLQQPESSYSRKARAKLSQLLHRWGAALNGDIVVVMRPDIPPERWERISGDVFQMAEQLGVAAPSEESAP